MSQFMACHETGTRRPRLIPIGEVARVEPQNPARAIFAYLRGLHAESVERGYRFDAGRIAGCDAERIDGAAPGRIGGCDAGRVPVTRGQIAFERTHLLAKLCARDPRLAARLRQTRSPAAHPLFRVVPGGIEPWERGGWSPT